MSTMLRFSGFRQNIKTLFQVFGLIFLLHQTLLPIGAQSKILFHGQDVYINGINLPWNNFGWDFGEHDEWGVGFDEQWFDDNFRTLADNGVNCVRIWVHCDGRGNPEFNDNGFITGLDNNQIQHMTTMLDLAQSHGLMVILTLWSHDMLEDYISVAGKHAGLHASIITNPEIQTSYLNNALIPMVQALSEHCSLLAWEIINEPEWCMEVPGGAKTKQTVSREEMTRFVANCIIAIRQHSDQMVTIGSFQSINNGSSGPTNYWHESEFEKLAYDCSLTYFDFYSIHYFPWMDIKDNPFLNPAIDWALGRPVLIAESASNGNASLKNMTPDQQLNLCLEQDYAGMLFWSFNATDNYSDWENCRPALKSFSEDHLEDELNWAECDPSNNTSPHLICSIYPNPASDIINIKQHSVQSGTSLLVDIFNMNGQKVKSKLLLDGTTEMNCADLSSGIYNVRFSILDSHGMLMQTFFDRIVLK